MTIAIKISSLLKIHIKMNKTIRNLIAAIAIAVPLLSPCPANAQDQIVIDPLFEYPTAPEEMTSLQDKSNYLVEHFWDKMDFKTKTTVDQNALNDAVRVYSVPMRWADKSKAIAATDKLISTISKNPTLLIQFTKAAEESMYGPRADVWIDEVYMRFLDAIVKNKKVPEARKKRYERQLSVLSKSALGNKAPEFKFTTTDGKEATYFPMTTVTMIIFGDPSQPDWRLARMKMETNMRLKQAVDKGKVNMLYIVNTDNPKWKSEVSNYPSNWTIGIATDAGETYDFRTAPSLYVIDKEGKIILKNATPESAVWEVLKQTEDK